VGVVDAPAWAHVLRLAVQIIAINQDAARIPGFRVWNSSTSQVWKKPLAGGDIAVLMLNAANSGSQTV